MISSDKVNVHWRDPQTALDSTSSMESVQEFIKYHPAVNRLALVQCTSPFITREFLRQAVKKFRTRDCVFSAVRSFKLRWNCDEKSGKCHPLNFNYKKRPRRQDWNGELRNISPGASPVPGKRWKVFSCQIEKKSITEIELRVETFHPSSFDLEP